MLDTRYIHRTMIPDPTSLSERIVAMETIFAEPLESSKDITLLRDTICHKSVTTRNKIIATAAKAHSLFAKQIYLKENCTASFAEAEDFLFASKCKDLGALTSKDSLCLKESSAKSLLVKRVLTLQASNIEKDVDVTTPSVISIFDSTIKGTLSCRVDQLTIRRSTIETLFIKKDYHSLLPTVFTLPQGVTVNEVRFQGGSGQLHLEEGAIAPSCVMGGEIVNRQSVFLTNPST